MIKNNNNSLFRLFDFTSWFFIQNRLSHPPKHTRISGVYNCELNLSIYTPFYRCLHQCLLGVMIDSCWWWYIEMQNIMVTFQNDDHFCWSGGEESGKKSSWWEWNEVSEKMNNSWRVSKFFSTYSKLTLYIHPQASLSPSFQCHTHNIDLCQGGSHDRSQYLGKLFALSGRQDKNGLGLNEKKC